MVVKTIFVLNSVTKRVFNFLLTAFGLLNGFLLWFVKVLCSSVSAYADFIQFSFLPTLRLRINYTFEERLAHLSALKSQYFSQVEIAPERLADIRNNTTSIRELLPALVNYMLAEKHAATPRTFLQRLGDFVYANSDTLLDLGF